MARALSATSALPQKQCNTPPGLGNALLREHVQDPLLRLATVHDDGQSELVGEPDLLAEHVLLHVPG